MQRIILGGTLAAVLCLSAAGVLQAGALSSTTTASGHFARAADNRIAAAVARMARARSLMGTARDLTAMPSDEHGQHLANLREAANSAMEAARRAERAVANYDQAVTLLYNLAQHIEATEERGSVQSETYREKAEECREKSLQTAIFVAEAYEWAASLYGQDRVDLDRQALAIENAAIWRETVANRLR